MIQDPANDIDPTSESEQDMAAETGESTLAQSMEDTRGTEAQQQEAGVPTQEKGEKASTKLTLEQEQAQSFGNLWGKLQDQLTEIEMNMLVNVSDRSKTLYYALWLYQANASFRRLGTLRKRSSHTASKKYG